MKKADILDLLQSLQLDWNEAVVVGSASLAILNVLGREARDIDLAVTDSQWRAIEPKLGRAAAVDVLTNALVYRGYKPGTQSGENILDVRTFSKTPGVSRTAVNAYAGSVIAEGCIRCASVSQTLYLKHARGMPKDLADLSNLRDPDLARLFI